VSITDRSPVDPILAAPVLAGPRGHWFSGCIRKMQTDPLAFYSQTQKVFGDYSRITVVPHFYCYLLTHPDAVEHILTKGQKNYRKPDLFYNSVGLLVGNGLFTNEGDAWLNQRKLAQPAFHTHTLANLAPLMVEAAEDFARRHESAAGQPIDMVDAMMRVGLRIASTSLFSTDMSVDADVIGKAFRTAFSHIGSRLSLMTVLPLWVPTPSNRAFQQAKRTLDGVVRKLITQRRQMADKPKDFLTMLINGKLETGRGLTDQQLMDEALTILTAGHENMGSALAWTWYLLAQNPDVQENLYDEIRASLQGRPPTFADLEHLPLAKAVFEESMRIFPPGWGELRESIGPDDLQGHQIPAKSTIVLCQWVTHRHPDFWPDPEKFNPERFLAPHASSQHRFAYFPFGGGPRICIGVQFALMEGPLVIATILQKYRVELAPGQIVVPDASFTLRPKLGLKIILRPRNPHSS
jgi:cytochrome P450